MSALDQMGVRNSVKQTRYGKKRANFEDLTGTTLDNGWRIVEFKYAYAGASHWSFECSKGCGATGVGPFHAIKKRAPCGCKIAEEAKTDTAIMDPLSRASYLTAEGLTIPTPRRIIDAVCSVYGYKFAQLSSSHRDTTLVEARWVAMYLMRRILNMSYPEIGRIMMRDHSTVYDGVKSIKTKLEESNIAHARLAQVAELLSPEKAQ